MIKTPTFQPEPLRNWLQYTLLSVTVAVSIFFFLAALKVMFNPSGGQLPAPPPPQATRLASPTAVDRGTAISTLAPAATGTPVPTATPQMSETPSATAGPGATPAGTTSSTPKAGTVRKLTPSGLSVVFVPGGVFRIGDPNGGGDDAPRHQVQLSAYWFSRTQVTNAQYARCVKAGGCSKPIRKAINPHYYDKAYANHPAVYITWDQAQAFCQWAGGSLPSEAQWEHAASGNRERTFPWGEDEPASYFTNVNHPRQGTVEVGKNRGNASPFGALDMGSNVREWVADWYSPRYYRVSPREDPGGPETGEKRVLRGAAWGDPNNFSKVWHRLAHVPGSAGANRGFRCAFPGDLRWYPVETSR